MKTGRKNVILYSPHNPISNHKAHVHFCFGKNALSAFMCVLWCRGLCGSNRGCAFFGGTASVVPLFFFKEESNMKKLVSLLLILVMVLGAFPLGVIAESFSNSSFASDEVDPEVDTAASVEEASVFPDDETDSEPAYPSSDESAIDTDFSNTDEDRSLSAAIVINTIPDWKKWSCTDGNWSWYPLGTGGQNTIGSAGCAVMALTKLAIQSGCRDANSYNVISLTSALNSNGGLNYYGGITSWANLANNIGNGFWYCGDSWPWCSSWDIQSEIISSARAGDQMILQVYIDDNEGTTHFIAVDNELTVLNNAVYILNSWGYPESNANIKLTDVFPMTYRIIRYRGRVPYIQTTYCPPTVNVNINNNTANISWNNVGAYDYYLTIMDTDTNTFLDVGGDMGTSLSASFALSEGNYKVYVTAIYSSDISFAGTKEFSISSPHTVTYYLDGEEYDCKTVYTGSAIPRPEVSVDYYSFSGWKLQDGSSLPAKMPAYDLDVYGTLTYTGIASGSCGDNATWTLNKNTGVLTISGTGSVQSYNCSMATGSTTLSDGTVVQWTYAPWYGARSSIKKAVIQDGITSLGNATFYGCSKMTEVSIPSSVNSFGGYNFLDCRSLRTVVIPDGVTTLRSDMFHSCTSLTSITLPSSVTGIARGVFYNCTSLASISIPSGVTSIGESAFRNCTSLQQISIPASVTRIGNYAFLYCDSLTAIDVASGNQNYSSLDGVLFNNNRTVLICCPGNKQGTYSVPSGVTEIGDSAFQASRITSVSIPSSVTSIITDAFRDCTELETVNMASGLLSIDEGVFRNCSSLTDVSIPASVTSIGNYAFSGCTSLISAEIGAGVTTIGNYAFSGCGSLLSTGAGGSVASIGSYAYYGCSSLTSAEVCCTAQSIGEYAFGGCGSLSSAVLSSGLSEIKSSTFYDCSSLESVVIPDSVTIIGGSAFHNCGSLTSVAIPGNVTSIYVEAFYGCTGLTSISIPSSVTSIGKNAFYGCSSLENITVDASNQNYCSNNGVLFNKACTQLIQYPARKAGAYDVPATVTSILACAFYECASLTSVTLPNGVESIGNNAFGFCESLPSISIPASVTSIGTGVFMGCTSLTAINVDSENSNYCDVEGVLYNKDVTELVSCPGAITILNIPSGVTAIGRQAAYGCTHLAEVIIPDGVTVIRPVAFSGCTGLESVYIPDSVTNISDFAFNDCTALKRIRLSNSMTSLGSIMNGCTSLEYVVVPAGITNVDGFMQCSSLKAVYFLGNKPGHMNVGISQVFSGSDPNFCVYYMEENASSWAPNGETMWGDTWLIFPIAPPTLTVNYLYSDGTVAAPQYCQSYTPGDEYYVESPIIDNYRFSTGCVSGIMLGDNIEVTVIYVPNLVTITYVGEYSAVVAIPFGSDAELPVLDVPGIHYTFTVNGEPWDGVNVTEDVTVEVGMDIDVYTVVFVDSVTGEALSTQQIEYGEAATAPSAPEHYGYTFEGWDCDYDCVTSDLTVRTIYNPVCFTVIFTDGLDNIISVQEVLFLEAAEEPELPLREGWVFSGWDADFSCITAAMVVNATWQRQYLTITFTGSYNGTETVEYGADCPLPVYNSSSICYIFKVNGVEWCPESITADTTVTVSVAPAKTTYHTVTFVGMNGEVIAEVQVKHGEAAIAPDAPSVAGYTFVGWDRENFDCVTYSMTRMAVYEQNLVNEHIGDINGDGEVTMADVSELIAYLMNSRSISDEGMANADANGDGLIDILDAPAICAIAMSV